MYRTYEALKRKLIIFYEYVALHGPINRRMKIEIAILVNQNFPMKRSLTFLFLSLFSQVFSQEYDGVYIEKFNVDKDNVVYKVGNSFYFDYHIIRGNDTLKMKKYEKRTFTLLPWNHDSIQLHVIPIKIVKPPFPGFLRRANPHQTDYESKYTVGKSKIYIRTGVVENEKNVWIHPPRFGYFQSLETCPFPYYIKNVAPNFQWKDSMLVGNHWSNPEWGIWNDNMLMKYTYTYVGQVIIETAFGEISCHKINAVADCEIGQSELIAYFSDKYGFVKLEYTLANKTRIIFFDLMKLHDNILKGKGTVWL